MLMKSTPGDILIANYTPIYTMLKNELLWDRFVSKNKAEANLYDIQHRAGLVNFFDRGPFQKTFGPSGHTQK